MVVQVRGEEHLDLGYSCRVGEELDKSGIFFKKKKWQRTWLLVG